MKTKKCTRQRSKSCKRGTTWNPLSCKCTKRCNKLGSCGRDIPSQYQYYGMQYPTFNRQTCRCECPRPEERQWCSGKSMKWDGNNCICRMTRQCERKKSKCSYETHNWDNDRCQCKKKCTKKEVECGEGRKWSDKTCTCECVVPKEVEAVSDYEPYAKYGSYLPIRDDNVRTDLNANCKELKPFSRWNKKTCGCTLNKKCEKKKNKCKEGNWDE